MTVVLGIDAADEGSIPSRQQIGEQMLAPLDSDSITVGTRLAGIACGQQDDSVGPLIGLHQQIAFLFVQAWRLLAAGSLGHGRLLHSGPERQYTV